MEAYKPPENEHWPNVIKSWLGPEQHGHCGYAGHLRYGICCYSAIPNTYVFFQMDGFYRKPGKK
jgi:hypothetical protein